MTWEEHKAKGIPGRLEAALNGGNPTLVTRLESGFFVLGDSQMLPGYCVLLAYPIVESLEAISLEERLIFLRDMNFVGQAIFDVCKPLRINYSILGNLDPYLHAHIQARYEYEEKTYRQGQVCLYPNEQFYATEVMFDPAKHDDLRLKLAARLQELQEQHI